MALATVLPMRSIETNRVRSAGMAFIPIVLDDLGLSLPAFRVFCHLCRRARLRDGQWWANPSLEGMGKICFQATYPNAKAPRLRILVAQAIEELEKRGLLSVKRSRAGNQYAIHPDDSWANPPDDWKNPNTRIRSRRLSQNVLGCRSTGDLDQDRSTGDLAASIHPRSSGDLAYPENIAQQSIQTDRDEPVPVDLTSVVDLSVSETRSPGDHNGDSINGFLIERERDFKDPSPEFKSKTLDQDLDARANFNPIEADEITVEYSFEDDQGNPINEQNWTVEPTIAASEPATPKAFDAQKYDWANYPGKSCPHVPIAFWRYSLSQVEKIKRDRDASGHPNPIGDPESYCRRMLQTQGLQRYTAWLKQPKALPATTAQGIHWSSIQPVIEPDLARSLIKQLWCDLKMGWNCPEIVAWMTIAEAKFAGFKYQPAQGFYGMPDAVVVKLCSDLQATLEKRLGGCNG